MNNTLKHQDLKMSFFDQETCHWFLHCVEYWFWENKGRVKAQKIKKKMLHNNSISIPTEWKLSSDSCRLWRNYLSYYYCHFPVGLYLLWGICIKVCKKWMLLLVARDINSSHKTKLIWDSAANLIKVWFCCYNQWDLTTLQS